MHVCAHCGLLFLGYQSLENNPMCAVPTKEQKQCTHHPHVTVEGGLRSAHTTTCGTHCTDLSTAPPTSRVNR